MKQRKRILEPGKCPKCGSQMITYGALEIEDGDFMYYPATCSDCGCKFKEWYSLTFQESEEDE